MEIVVAPKKKKKLKPSFKVDISFMIGDADGWINKSVKLIDNETNRDALGKLMLALECCTAAYPNGMGGYDEYHGLHPYDAFFVEDLNERLDLDDYQEVLINAGVWETGEEKEIEFIKKYLKETWNPLGLKIEHEYSHDGEITTSFSGFTVSHTDADGKKSDVIATYSKEEKKLIKYAKELFLD